MSQGTSGCLITAVEYAMNVILSFRPLTVDTIVDFVEEFSVQNALQNQSLLHLMNQTLARKSGREFASVIFATSNGNMKKWLLLMVPEFQVRVLVLHHHQQVWSVILAALASVVALLLRWQSQLKITCMYLMVVVSALEDL